MGHHVSCDGTVATMAQTAPPESSPLTTAVRDAARVDRSAISPAAGLLAGIPVFALLGGLIAVGEPVAAVTSTVGAMLVGIAWRVAGGRPPLIAMATDAVLMALATFIGCITGHILWLHLIVLAAWAFGGGLLVGAGRQAGIVGFQSILAVVVFGRFSEPIGPALGIAGLVGAGGLTEVAFLTIVRWPRPLAVQRRATASAYRELATFAGAESQISALPAAGALDEAAASLASGSLLGASAVRPLRNLVNEGLRLRITLSALTGLAGRTVGGSAAAADLHTVAIDTAAALRAAADTVEGSDGGARELERLTARITDANTALRGGPVPGGTTPELWTTLMRRLAGLGGQLRAVAALAPAAATGSGLRGRRPQSRTSHPLQVLTADLTALRANLNRDSPALRHAVRIAIIVPAAELIARVLPVQRGYWMVVAAAAVLRPEFGATFTRGTERAGGTALGVAFAGLITVTLHPAGDVTVVLVGVCAIAGFSCFAASYALGFACITALVVFLLNTLTPDTLSVATDRLIDTLIGGTLGLLVFAAWPTWSRRPAQESLAALTLEARRYLTLVLGALIHGEPVPEQVRSVARATRLARTRAEADVSRSLGEPVGRRIDARVATAVLSEMLRLVQAVHGLRLEADDDHDRPAFARLAPLARALDVQLGAIARALASDELQLSSEHVDLRTLFTQFADDADADEHELLIALDELVDVINAIDELVA
jgi:uncharacterized membrane protein YccC